VTGIELKIRRVTRGVRVTDLAHRMGLKTHSRVSQIEAMRQVPPKAAVRYLAALETFPNVEQEAA
jgi:transcriptional regulator with XRE-family HTH domain